MNSKNNFLLNLISLQEPISWIIDKSANSILDVGCGQGFPMELLKKRMTVKNAVGVDLFEPYIKETKKKKIHNKYVICDIKNLPFKDKSFDVVMALQVLEHLPKKDAWKVLEKMEKIAKKQIIIATPIGRMHHPDVDHNPLQVHKSFFKPEEFSKRGYKVLKFGRKSLLGEKGMVHNIKSDFLRKIIFIINFILTPFYYLVQPLSDYHFYAYKKIEDTEK